MAEEAGHDLVGSVASVVVRAFGVGPPHRTGGFEALVGHEGAWDTEAELGRGFHEREPSCRVDVWHGGDGTRVIPSTPFLVPFRDRYLEATVGEVALEVKDGVRWRFHESGWRWGLRGFAPMAGSYQVTRQRETSRFVGSRRRVWEWTLDVITSAALGLGERDVSEGGRMFHGLYNGGRGGVRAAGAGRSCVRNRCGNKRPLQRRDTL